MCRDDEGVHGDGEEVRTRGSSFGLSVETFDSRSLESEDEYV